MLSPLTSANYEENRHRAPECRFASLGGRNGTSKPRLGKTLLPPRPGHYVCPTVEQPPRIRTSSFVVFHMRLALSLLGPRPAIGHICRVPRQRRSGLDSHLQLRSRKGIQREKRLLDTQHRVQLVKLPKAVLQRRSARPLYGAPPCTPDASGTVGLRRNLCWYRST